MVQNLRRQNAVAMPFWKTQAFNLSIGTNFAIGSFIFGLGSILMFCSFYWQNLNNITNLTFFAGSVSFTVAAGMAHLQSANANSVAAQAKQNPTYRIKLIGWNPTNLSWLSTFTQFLGTIAFNISTFHSIAPSTQSNINKLEIWAPNFEGSIFFLISGYLAFVKVGKTYWSWQPKDIAWQSVFINLLGCIAFMTSALLPSTIANINIISIFIYSNTYTLIGAICFLMSSLLMIKEAKIKQ